MSRRGTREAAAGLVVAAAGVAWRRLAGRRRVAPAEPGGGASDAPLDSEPREAEVDELTRARGELGEELARRAERRGLG